MEPLACLVLVAVGVATAPDLVALFVYAAPARRGSSLAAEPGAPVFVLVWRAGMPGAAAFVLVWRASMPGALAFVLVVRPGMLEGKWREDGRKAEEPEKTDRAR